MRDIGEFVKKQGKESKEKKEEHAKQELEDLMRKDMAEMIKESRRSIHLNYPDPIRPQWKN